MKQAEEMKETKGREAKRGRILYVEDDRASRMLVKKILTAEGFDVIEAEDGIKGYELAVKHRPDLIIVDINLPGFTGYEVATKLKATDETKDIPIIALTAYAMEGDKEKALVAGCDGYLEKPIDVDSFTRRVVEYLGGKRESPPIEVATKYLREYSQNLVDRLEDKIKELESKSNELEAYSKKMEETYIGIISSFMKAIEEKHLYTAGHSERVTQYALDIADLMQLSEQEKNILRRAARLHDVGKITVETATIDKGAGLEDEEWDAIRRHPEIGTAILKPLGFLEEEIKIVRDHHERLDGSGYPEGKKGDRIGLLSRILAVADSFDAMTSFRRYRKTLSEEEALNILLSEAGVKYDAKVVDALVEVLKKRHNGD